MKTITANIPENKKWKLPARCETFTQNENGTWHGQMGAILEEDVIDICQKASNWKAIRIEFFPMFGFHN